MLRLIGEGSYGEVWLARNVIGTYRAVKVVYRRNFDDDRPYEREFAGIKNFEPVSRSHEGLVDILQVGRDDAAGYFYYVMEAADDVESGQEIHPNGYIPKTLSLELRQRGRLPFKECVERGLSLISALGHLHKHKLIHRDIKPANIIFVHGVLKLADIGLVAGLGDARSFVGTEGYIPPEGPGKVQADIYSLGKVLYEISTGKDRHAYPALPESIADSPTREDDLEFNAIVSKACAAEVEDRYQDTEALKNEMVLLQAGRSVRRLRTLEQIVRRLKSIGVAVGLLLLFVGVAWTLHVRNVKRDAEIRQRRVGSYVANGSRALDDGLYLSAIPQFVEALKLDQDAPGRAQVHRVRLASVLNRSPKLAQMWFLDREIRSVNFSPDGLRVLVASDKAARVFEIASGRPAAEAIPYSGIDSAVCSPDGSQIVLSGANNVIVCDAATGEKRSVLPHSDYTYSACFSHDGRRIVTSCGNHNAYVWNALTGERLFRLEQHHGDVQYAEFSHNDRYIVTTSQDKTACLWNAEDGHLIKSLTDHRSWVFHASFSPDDRYLATSSFDNTVLLWRVPSGEREGREFEHPAAVRSVEFTPDGRYLVCACWDQTVRTWDLRDRKPVLPHLNHSAKVNCAAVSGDGRRIVTGAIDGTVRVWDLALKAHPTALSGGAFSADGRMYAVASNEWLLRFSAAQDQPLRPAIQTERSIKHSFLSADGGLALSVGVPDAEKRLFAQSWDTTNGKPLCAPFELVAGSVAAMSPDGRQFVTTNRHDATVWDTATGQPVGPGFGHPEHVEKARFSPSGARVATAAGTRVFVLDAATGKPVGQPLIHDRPVHNLAFSADGRRMVTVCADPSLDALCGYVWDLASGLRSPYSLPHQDGVLAGAFSPNGRRVATSGEDDTAFIWDAQNGLCLSPPLRHATEVHGLAFSPDGEWLATGDLGSARVWDANTGEPLTPRLPHSSPLDEVRFIAGGRRLATHQARGFWEIWDLPPDQHPLETLELFSQLLSSSTPHFSGGLLPLNKDMLHKRWDQLHAKSSGDFLPAPADIRFWHESAARMNEIQKRPFAAAFHLAQLLKADPAQPDLVRRLAEAQAALSQQTGPSVP